MTILIGPTFIEELRAAGLTGNSLEGVSWGEDGVIEYRNDVPQTVRDTILSVLSAHDPTKPIPPSHTDLTDLVTIAIGSPAEAADARARLVARRP